MLDEKRSLLERVFPGQVFDDDQVEAMSEFVQTCMEDGYGDEEMMEGEEGPKGKGVDLVLAFGGKPKSKE